MSAPIDPIVQLGHDITSNKYYGMATATVLFYDYFLTLEDEVKYVWSGGKSWLFWLFIFNRYFPMTFQFWNLAVSYGPYFNMGLCNRTVFYSTLTCTVCNLLAQVVLTVRVYAITMANIPVTMGFATITASQLGVGIWMVVLAARRGASYTPPLPLDPYNICVSLLDKRLLVACISIGLFYDLLVFSFVIFLSRRSKTRGLEGPRILGVVADDATRYFLVIFTSHFVFEITVTLGRDGIQALPSFGIFVFLPVMISRIVLSLRKAVDPQRDAWSLAGPPSNTSTLRSMKFVRPRGGLSERGGDPSFGTYTEL